MPRCSTPSTFLICTLTLCSVLCAPSFADEDLLPPQAPMIEEVPDVPTVLPPDLLNRPQLLPAYQNAGGAQATFDGTRAPQATGKLALAWRTKAAQLRDSSGSLKAIATSFAGTYEDALMTLVSLLPQFGLRAAVLNSKGGEVLAVPADNSGSRATYVFTINEMPPLTVNIKGTALNQTKAPQTFSILQDLMNAVARTPAGKGILQ